MAHRPLPVPTGNKKQDRAAKSKYVNEHVDLIRTDLGLPTTQNKAKEIRSGKYTSGGKHLFGMQPVKGGFFTSEDPTTEDIPFEGPFTYARQEANNIRWVVENKNLSDQESKILTNLALDIDEQIILGLDRDITYNNQADRNTMGAGEFFSTGTEGVPSDLPGDQALFPESSTTDNSEQLSTKNDVAEIKSNEKSGVTSKDKLDNQKSPLTISDADRELGSTPWARKGLMDSPKLANQATWRLLEAEGYDLRGVQDKDRLAADYRLGRLNKTDKGLWYENKFLRNK